MPRLPKSESERQYEAVRRHIREYLYDGCKSGGHEAAALRLGMKYARLNRLSRCETDKFTLGELQTIANTLNITIPTLLGIKEKES